MNGGMFKGLTGALITIGAVGTILIGGTAYVVDKTYSSKKSTRNNMEWIADHNAVYGNRNGNYDLEERIGILKDLGKISEYAPEQQIKIEDAKTYIKLYDKCTIHK
jgi:hypothetical protein